MMKTAKVAGVVLLLGSGCGVLRYRGTYDPTAFASRPIAREVKLPGRVVILTTPEDDAFVWSGRPEGFVGSAGTLDLPMGVVVREAAVRTFGDLFLDGVAATGGPEQGGDARVVVRPRFGSLAYSNEIWSQRTAVEVSIQVAVIGRDGQVAFERTYASRRWRTPPHRPDKPFEQVVMGAVQVATQAVMLDAARDVKGLLEGKGPAPAP